MLWSTHLRLRGSGRIRLQPGSSPFNPTRLHGYITVMRGLSRQIRGSPGPRFVYEERAEGRRKQLNLALTEASYMKYIEYHRMLLGHNNVKSICMEKMIFFGRKAKSCDLSYLISTWNRGRFVIYQDRLVGFAALEMQELRFKLRYALREVTKYREASLRLLSVVRGCILICGFRRGPPLKWPQFWLPGL